MPTASRVAVVAGKGVGIHACNDPFQGFYCVQLRDLYEKSEYNYYLLVMVKVY